MTAENVLRQRGYRSVTVADHPGGRWSVDVVTRDGVEHSWWLGSEQGDALDATIREGKRRIETAEADLEDALGILRMLDADPTTGDSIRHGRPDLARTIDDLLGRYSPNRALLDVETWWRGRQVRVSSFTAWRYFVVYEIDEGVVRYREILDPTKGHPRQLRAPSHGLRASIGAFLSEMTPIDSDGNVIAGDSRRATDDG